MRNRIGIFLQVRLGSRRLPGKALLEIEGKPIIVHAMESLNRLSADCRALLTDSESSEVLLDYAGASGFELFAGPRDDVLKRYVLAAEKYNIDTIVRATGDNPLVDSLTAKMILESHIRRNADYSGYDGPPLGTGVEILRASALKTAEKASEDDYDHEHVAPYLYKNPDRFKINRIQAPPEYCLEGAAVTIDTRDDYDYVLRLYKELYDGGPVPILKTIGWLRNNRRTG